MTIIVNVREIRFCDGCLTSYVSSRRPPRSEPLQLSPVSPVSSHRGNKFTFLAQISSPWRNPDTLLSSWRAAPVMTRLALIATSVNTHTPSLQTLPPEAEARTSSLQQALDTLARLYFMKVLLLDIGLSICDSLTDLIQSTREHSCCCCF